MAATAADDRRARLEGMLRFQTPFWAGGATRDADGRWQLPAPGAFQGCAKIVNKEAKLVPLLPNPWQLELDDKLEGQRAEGKPMRAIVLKARKLGMSTWIAAKFLQRVTQMEFQRAVVIAQDVKTAGVILEMAQIIHSQLPMPEEIGGLSVRPPIIKESNSKGSQYMRFGEAGERLRRNGRIGDSFFEIDTANSPESGRGSTPTMAHLSEVARWEGNQAIKKMISILNAVPPAPETIVVLESTANGLNHFYRRWISARDGANDPDTGETYIAYFVPWWRDQTYVQLFATVEDRARFVETIGRTDLYGEVVEDEPMLEEAYGCTPEQLAWRRMMIRTQHEGSIELFNQENPHSDESAFIGSGRTVFSGLLVTRAIKAAAEAPEPVVGSLRAGEVAERRSRAGTVIVPTTALWVASHEMSGGTPELRVWEHPVKATDEWPEDVPEEERVDGAYVVAVDCASGEADTFTKGDFHCIQVFDHRTHMQVAVHESRMDIHELPLWVLLVAVYYNRAWLAVEVQGPGIAVVDPLQKTYRYPRMYRRKRIDRLRNVEENRPGWSTDQVEKPVMEGTFGAALQAETHGLRDPGTARQLSTYVITEKGKHEAQHGENDDRLVTAMIAHRVMEVLRPVRSGKRRRGNRYDPADPLTGW